jgi:hypothetical protein
MGYQSSAARVISGGTDIEISRLSFTGGGVALVVENVVRPYLHDLDFDGCVGAIFLLGCTDIRIEDIRARNIGDGTIGSGHSNVIQLNSTIGGAIRRVRGRDGHTEDMISVFKSGGSDAAHPGRTSSCAGRTC